METLFIGKNSLFLHEVESTNTYAMNLLRNVNLVEGTAVYTDNQTAGRGQRGSVWTSKIGENVITSIVLKPQFLSIENTFYLSKISALAVYDLLTDVLSQSQYDIKIKWPNDIVVNKRKIAGILIENIFNTNTLKYSVIGIGLNVNQIVFEDYDRAAVSLNILENKTFDRKIIMNLLFSKIEKWYFKLKSQKYDVIDSEYQKKLFGLNTCLSFKHENYNVFDAQIVGVTKEGKLQLKLNNQEIKNFDIKELKFLI